VKVKNPIQVVTMYSTAVVMKNGEVHFFRDIYGEDAALEKELSAQPRRLPTGPTPPSPTPSVRTSSPSTPLLQPRTAAHSAYK
jgi:hypothetical protein